MRTNRRYFVRPRLHEAGRLNLNLLTALVAFSVVAAVVVASLGPTGAPQPWLLFGLTGATVLFEALTARFSIGSNRWTMSISEVCLAVALILEPGVWVSVAGAAGMVAAQYIRRQKEWRKIAFNTGQYALSYGAAGWAAHALGGGVIAGAVGVFVFWVLNMSLVALAVSFASGAPIGQTFRDHWGLSAYHACTNASIGLGVGHLMTVHAPSALAFAWPVATILLSYELITRRVDETRLLDMMLSEHDSVRTRSTDETAQLVLLAARQLFGTDAVDMLILAPADDPASLVLERGRVVRRPLAAEDLEQPWVLEALAAPIPVRIGNSREGSWCVARLGDSSNPFAVLTARKPAGSAEGITRRDQRLAEQLVERAENWLSAAVAEDRAAGQQRHNEEVCADARRLADLGAATAPTLATLRSAAYRLVELAADHGRDTDIVTELHRVEKSVATLLGAIRLHADTAAGELPTSSSSPDLLVTGHASDVVDDAVAGSVLSGPAWVTFGPRPTDPEGMPLAASTAAGEHR